MKLKKLLLALCFTLVLFCLAACGAESDASLKVKEIYDEAVENGFTGTYEEWLNSLKGEKGDAGIDGKNGVDGISPMLQINATTNMWEISYDKGATWASLEVKATGEQGTAGNDGVTPKFQIHSGVWEVSYDNGATWTSLNIKATGEKGDAGEDGKMPKISINTETNTWVISYDDGATWSSLGVKATGETGQSGSNGADGISPQLQIANGEWEISYDKGATWTKLGVKATGDTGATGAAGVTPKLQINTTTNVWEVSYDDGANWISLGVKATGDTGATGNDGATGKDAITYVPAIFYNGEGTKIYEFYYAYGTDIVYNGPSPDYQVVDGTSVQNYTFTYWDNSLKNITQPTIFKAQYTSETYTGHKVTFTDYNDNVLYEHYYKDGTTANYPYVNQPFSYDDTNVYIFNGWNHDLKNVSADFVTKPNVITIPRDKNGEYPQSVVKDPSLVTELAKITDTDANGYITYKGEKYLPFTGIAYNDKNGCAIAAGLQYYKVEPIQWRILLTETGKLCLVAEYIIDNQQFNPYYKDNQSRTDYNGETAEVACSNYKYSNIRTWLNTTFFNTAFADNSLVLLTEINNGLSTISKGATYTNDYVCENTFDKVFLLSLEETWYSQWAVGSFDAKKGHLTTGTDFAKASGWINYTNNYATRSPYEASTTIYTIGPGGNTMVWGSIDSKFGIRPAIYLEYTTGD